jgi:hypothetical protein
VPHKRPRHHAAAQGLVCACAVALTLTSCAAELADDGEKVQTTLAELEVAEHARGSACSTTVVRGLTEQLVAEINCMHPDTLRSIASIPSVDLSSAATAAPYLTRDAAAALGRAAGRGSGSMRINSALRTLPQQYLLYRWKQRGLCGIRAAARPGRSNHESALAVDVSGYSAWRSHLAAEGFRWAGSSDPVHFDYSGSSIGNLSIRAFQRLWNRNHPSDRIAEDGAYGPATESRLARTPAEGFPIGACGAGGPSGPGDAGTPGADLGCDRGVACSDCNAIARNCGFCAGSRTCMAGDGSGPWTGSCASGWQWITPSSCPAPEDPPGDPPPGDPMPGDLAAAHRGLTLDGHEIPRTGLYNPYLPGGGGNEPHGTVTTHAGLSFVRGRVSWFGGPNDTGVTSTETGAITGERLRSLHDPDPASASTVASRPADYYFVAMRWRYLYGSSLGDVGTDLRWWREQRIAVMSPSTGRAVVLRPADWGPHPTTNRIIDVSHQALRDLGVSTDAEVLTAFVDPMTPLGPIALGGDGGTDPPPDDGGGTEPPPPGPMCTDVRGSCGASSDCCGAMSCRRGASYPQRCCVEPGNTCASGGDCCGYTDCVSGRCACRAAGRACLAAGDCCSATCTSGTCR